MKPSLLSQAMTTLKLVIIAGAVIGAIWLVDQFVTS